MAPPSLHHLHGDRYEWAEGRCSIDAPLAEVPDWLAAVVVERPRPAPPPPSSCTGSKYGTAALEAEVGRVALAAEGTRNDELVRAAFRLGQLVASGQLDATTVASSLLVVAMRSGLTEFEAVATIRSGMAAGMTAPRRPEVTR